MNALHDVLDDFASGVRTVDLTQRVTAGVRRRRQRRVAGLATATAALVALASLSASRLGERSSDVTTSPESAVEVVWISSNPRDGYVLHGQGADGRHRDLGTYPRSRRIDLAPDGLRIAYPTDRGIAVMTFADRSVREYTAPMTSEFLTPVWSPDGRTIAYSLPDNLDHGVQRGFALLDVVTGRVTQVSYPHATAALAWSPDGTTIALSRPRSKEGVPGGIDVVTRDGGGRTLTREPWLVSGPHAWSPDGAHLIVTAGTRYSTPTIISVTTGEVVGEMPDYNVYVWGGAAHVVSVDDALVERALDGTVTRSTPLDRTTPDLGDPVVRPAS